MYRVSQETGLFLSVGNLGTVSGRKTYDMSKSVEIIVRLFN